MNVRFFGGYKSEYVSIPRHNPIGLYFCADSRELFLGDKLLSDGLRVVPTFADLPSISEHKAAEGVIYFVEETKNGYVLPSGRSDWLQVIYAPTTGDGGEVDLSNYYTKAEVDEAILEAIANIKIEVDLDDYYTKSEVEALIPDVSGFATKTEIPSVDGLASETYVDNKVAEIEIPVKVSELENDAGYATETYVAEAIAAINPVVEEVKQTIETEVLPIVPTVQKVEEILPTVQELAEKAATQDWVKEQGYLTEHQDLSEYSKKSDLVDIEQHISNTYITQAAAAEIYVTTEKITEVVTNEVNTVVTDQIETKVTEVIEKKIEDGNLEVKADTISYDTW